MNIFVAKLDYSIQEDELREIFEDYGQVDSCKIIMDKFTGRSKGYGFVEMPSEDEGNNAIESLNEAELEGRQIVVKKARPRENNGRGGHRGGGGGRDRRFNNDRNDRY
jgi:RNA recognition motif-containing protein